MTTPNPDGNSATAAGVTQEAATTVSQTDTTTSAEGLSSDPSRFSFGELNAITEIPNAPTPPGYMNPDGPADPFASHRTASRSSLTPQAIQQAGIVDWLGIVLRIEEVRQDSGTDDGSWDSACSRVSGNQTPKVNIKVRIPELHVALPEPAMYGDAAPLEDQLLMDMYPTFIGEVSGLPTPQPGDIVRVKFGNLATQSDPKYIGPLVATVGGVGGVGAFSAFGAGGNALLGDTSMWESGTSALESYRVVLTGAQATAAVSAFRTILLSMGYVWQEATEHPVAMNCIGVRSATLEANKFRDRFNCCWFKNGQWTVYSWPNTTTPGYDGLTDPSYRSGGGVAIMVPGQYRAWKIRNHGSSSPYPAGSQRVEDVRIYRDTVYGTTLNMDPASITEGKYGINIHRSSATRRTSDVGPWSLGCQVFQENAQGFAEWMALFTEYETHYGEAGIYYSLVPETAFSGYNGTAGSGQPIPGRPDPAATTTG